MKAANVKLILFRELRDQLRDRRTLFSVVVLPVLLYPLLGLLIMQVTQLRQQSITKLQIIGTNELPDVPLLLEDGAFPESLLNDSVNADQFQIDEVPEAGVLSDIETAIQERIKTGEYGVIVYFPPGFADRMETYRLRQSNPPEEDEPEDEMGFPEPRLFVNSANDKSQGDLRRLQNVLMRWRDQVVAKNLEAHDVPHEVTNPFVVNQIDIAEEPEKRALLWSKIFPFIVVIWALTGAFYPAIDLCAGEKERGTLETLLSSPALRSEIVGGKLLAVMTFSIATSLLNLASMGITAMLVMQQIQSGGDSSPLNIGSPPLGAIGWLLLALIPMAALFSALSLAVAALARSSKEGQYYLVPLLLINLPLVVLPVLPNFELSLGTSIIPVTGVLLLMKALMEGNYLEAAKFVVPVMAVTSFCIWLAVRWAIDQFNNESVLFRESERFDIRLWLSQTIRDRGATPTFGAAVIAGLVLLMLKFFISPIVMNKFVLPYFPPEAGTVSLVVMILVSQILLILIPVLLFAWLTCRSAKATFLFSKPNLNSIPLAILLAIFIHPLSMNLGELIKKAFPMDPATLEALASFSIQLMEAPFPLIILLLAVTPAICEELVFRGYILSGLRHMGHKWTAICISAFLFGVTHGLLQQSISAGILGVVIGFIAVQSGSIWPGMVYHLVHNSIPMLYTRLTPALLKAEAFEIQILNFRYHFDYSIREPLSYFFQINEIGEGTDYEMTIHTWIVAVCSLFVVLILRWFYLLPAPLSEEERLQSALEHQGSMPRQSQAVAEETIELE